MGRFIETKHTPGIHLRKVVCPFSSLSTSIPISFFVERRLGVLGKVEKGFFEFITGISKSNSRGGGGQDGRARGGQAEELPPPRAVQEPRRSPASSDLLQHARFLLYFSVCCVLDEERVKGEAKSDRGRNHCFCGGFGQFIILFVCFYTTIHFFCFSLFVFTP